MPAIFNPRAEGGVTAVSFGRAVPADVKIQGFSLENTVITGLRTAQSANVQFMPTLRNTLFVYSFGDQMGHLELFGVCFNKSCNSGFLSEDPEDIPDRLPINAGSFAGFKDILAFYERRGLGRSIFPSYVSLGQTSIRAFFMGYNVSSSDPMFNLTEFSMTFAVPPAVSGNRQQR